MIERLAKEEQSNQEKGILQFLLHLDHVELAIRRSVLPEGMRRAAALRPQDVRDLAHQSDDIK
jgi:hypothetical protein